MSNNSLKPVKNDKVQKTNQIFFALFAVFVLGWMIFLFKSYLLTISIGILLAVATANIQNFFLRATKGKRLISTIFTTIFFVAIFIIPFIYAVVAIFEQGTSVDIGYLNSIVTYVKNYDFTLPSKVQFLEPKFKELLLGADFNSLVTNAFNYIKGSLEKSASFFTDIGLIVLFFFLSHLYGSELASYIKSVTPMAPSELEFIFLEVTNTMSVVFYTTIANAILQGFLFSLIVLFYGQNGLLFGVLFGFASLIPIVGGALVYVPFSIYELSIGDTFGAISIFLYSVIVISTLADNFIKPLIIKFINQKLVKTKARMNELVLFFAGVAGLSSFGFWGVILGPAIVTLTTATLRLYVLLKERGIM